MRLRLATAAERLLDAVMKGDQRAVRELLRQRADVNTAQPDGSTVLMLAVERNYTEIADLLIRAQANVNAANEYGATALFVASANGHVALIRRLLEGTADPNAPLLSGETPLMAAVDNGHLDAASTLLERGAEVNAKETNGGQTALMWAPPINLRRSCSCCSRPRSGHSCPLQGRFHASPVRSTAGRR